MVLCFGEPCFKLYAYGLSSMEANWWSQKLVLYLYIYKRYIHKWLRYKWPPLCRVHKVFENAIPYCHRHQQTHRIHLGVRLLVRRPLITQNWFKDKSAQVDAGNEKPCSPRRHGHAPQQLGNCHLCERSMKVPTALRTKFPPLMVLSVISNKGDVVPPHFFADGLHVTTVTYVDVLADAEPRMEKVLKGRPYVFQQVSNTAHTAGVAQEWLTTSTTPSQPTCS